MAAHFEIHVRNLEAVKAPQSGFFGWGLAPIPSGDSGGLMRRMGKTPAPGRPVRGGTMTFEVRDYDDRYALALAHGGAEALPPADYARVGRCAYVKVGQGNIVGMITPASEEN